MKVLVIFSLLFTVLLLNDVQCRRHNHQRRSKDHRIVSGYDVDIESVPYQAVLLRELEEGTSFCGASIIDDWTILSAAHCLVNLKNVRVRVGSVDRYNGGEVFEASSFTIHPKYTSEKLDYDVGVVRLKQRIYIDGKKTKAVKLPNKGEDIEPGTTIVISGWGATAENGDVSDHLKAVEVFTVSNDECRQSYGNLNDRMLCAGVPEGGKDTCQGDSGGPAVTKDTGIQVGITSFGAGCARKGYPGVYARVANDEIRDWIKEVSGV